MQLKFPMEKENGNWQDLKPRERMLHLLDSGHLSDCSFVVYDEDGKKIILKCHKFVLMTGSPVFERMFEGNFQEAKLPENIVLDDVSGPDFKKFIEYLYWNGSLRADQLELPTLQTLIYLSKKFMVNSLTSLCLTILKKRLGNSMHSDDIVDLYEYAHQLEDADLINSIIMKFRNNPHLYISAAAVFDLSSEVFLQFISEFHCFVTEKQRFDVIDKYCRIHGLLEFPLKEEPTETKSEAEQQQGERVVLLAKRSLQTKTHALPSKSDQQDQEGDNQNKIDEEVLTAKSEEKSQTEEEKLQELEKKELEQMKKKEYILKLMKCIQFTSMTAHDFCVGPGASPLLSVEEKFDYLSSICTAEHKKRFLSPRL